MRKPLATIPRPIAPAIIFLLLVFVAARPAAADGAEEARARDDAGDRLSRIEQAMWNQDPGATPLLREWAAGDPSDRVRERSVGALALIRDPEAVPVFLGRLGADPSPAVRRAAAEAIAVLRPAVDIGRLAIPLRKDPDPFVRAECARAIGRIGNARSAPALVISVVQDPSPEVRALAAEALAALQSPNSADVLNAVAQQDNSLLVRIYAVRALAAMSPGSSASLFRTVWEGSSDPELRIEAFRGLLLAERGDVWERVGLADADEQVRFLAFRQWLVRTLESRKTSRGRGMPNHEFAARLEEFLADRVRGIRELAKAQLEALGVKVRPYGFGYAVEH